MSNNLVEVTPEYVYVTIPAEYICVYHRILAMLADYGEEMLKDCKASCTDKNAGVIECFNMFNAAVAARKLRNNTLANVLITYVKEKINMIYKGHDNSTSFVFPIDENGQLKAFVSCGERPRFWINENDGNLYEHKFNNGFTEHFKLSPEDENQEDDPTTGLYVELTPKYHLIDDTYHACAEIECKYDNEYVNLRDTTYQYYFDDIPVINFNDVTNISVGMHNFTIVVTYNNETKIDSKDLYYYGNTNR